MAHKIYRSLEIVITELATIVWDEAGIPPVAVEDGRERAVWCDDEPPPDVVVLRRRQDGVGWTVSVHDGSL